MAVGHSVSRMRGDQQRIFFSRAFIKREMFSARWAKMLSDQANPVNRVLVFLDTMTLASETIRCGQVRLFPTSLQNKYGLLCGFTPITVGSLDWGNHVIRPRNQRHA